LATGSAIPADYIKAESRAGRMGQELLAVVAEGPRGRVYCAPTPNQIAAAAVENPPWVPRGKNPEKLTGGTVFVYGMDEWWKLFSTRQLVALNTLSEVLGLAHERIQNDALLAGLPDRGERFRNGGLGATAYADAIMTYLAFAIDKCADYWSTIATWDSTKGETVRNTFARQAIPMTWNWVETSPFSSSTGSLALI
jgi:putative DNA methylase